MAKQGEFINKVITGDCLKVLPKMRAGSVDLIFADPPFNIGYDYRGEYDDNLKHEAYVDWCGEWISACRRVLKPNGAMFIAIGDEYAAELKIRATKELDEPLHLRNWIIWHYRFGQNTRTKFARSHAHIFYLVKDPQDFIFNADPVRVMSDRQKNYADKRAFKTLGKLPDDVWDEFPRVCGTFDEREGAHPCQMPESLLARIIRACSEPGSLVVDPFAGSGTTLAVAKKLGRDYLGIELSSSFSNLIRRRLGNVLAPTQMNGRGSKWSARHLDELNALYLESGVALERLLQSEYLQKLFTAQFHVRIEEQDSYSASVLMNRLKLLRRTGKLSKTLVLDSGRTYSAKGSDAPTKRAPSRKPKDALLFG